MNTIAETPFHNDPLEFELSESDGVKSAVNPILSLAVMPDGETKIFKRRAIKNVGSRNPTYETMLVGELDGVRVYVKGNDIILTKQNLRL
jgi:hypothetical protein